MVREKLLLSADGNISLYEVKKEIIDNLDNLLDEFYKTKKTNCYDETLFVKFLIDKKGEDSICFIKVVGMVGGTYNPETQTVSEEFPEEYRNIKWYNF
jgi:hypothetical protein